MQHQYIERLVDLTQPESNQIYNMSVEEAQRRILEGTPEEVREIDGTFALIAKKGKTVRMARSLDHPLRYFLAKRSEGPALVVADRIDIIYNWLKENHFDDQFHPSYTRMIPAHYVVEIQLLGCPDPNPVYTRFFDPPSGTLSTDLDEIGRRYIGNLANEIQKWLSHIPDGAPVGVSFSGGIDSGSVFLVTYHVMRKMGMNPGRLKAFTLDLGDGPDRDQAFRFLDQLGLSLFLEPIEVDEKQLDAREAIRIVEDYKPLDIQSAVMSLALFKGIHERYPDWKYILDGEGGDENLRDYPIDANPELTIRSIINNRMLYHEGWGVDKIKHSLTFSGGLSRSYARSYATAKHMGFEGFSPYTRPDVVEVAESIPFKELTEYDEEKLFRLKGDVVSRGVKAITGLDMPVFEKRRFQHGAISENKLQTLLPQREMEYRKTFQMMYL